MARENIDAILSHLDEIGRRIVTLAPDGNETAAQGSTASQGAAVTESKAAGVEVARDTRRVIRADLADMEAVLEGVTETHARLNGLRRSAEAAEQLGHLASLLRAQLGAPANEQTRRSIGAVNASKAIADELGHKIGGLVQQLRTNGSRAPSIARRGRRIAAGSCRRRAHGAQPDRARFCPFTRQKSKF